jgi:hypothetical protein
LFRISWFGFEISLRGARPRPHPECHCEHLKGAWQCPFGQIPDSRFQNPNEKQILNVKV